MGRSVGRRGNRTGNNCKITGSRGIRRGTSTGTSCIKTGTKIGTKGVTRGIKVGRRGTKIGITTGNSGNRIGTNSVITGMRKGSSIGSKGVIKNNKTPVADVNRLVRDPAIGPISVAIIPPRIDIMSELPLPPPLKENVGEYHTHIDKQSNNFTENSIEWIEWKSAC